VNQRQFERVQCPVCGRSVAAYVPAGYDGQDVRLVPHNTHRRWRRPLSPPTQCVGSDRLLAPLRARHLGV
jgi:rRNA maturation protein Nop10